MSSRREKTSTARVSHDSAIASAPVAPTSAPEGGAPRRPFATEQAFSSFFSRGSLHQLSLSRCDSNLVRFDAVGNGALGCGLASTSASLSLNPDRNAALALASARSE